MADVRRTIDGGRRGRAAVALLLLAGVLAALVLTPAAARAWEPGAPGPTIHIRSAPSPPQRPQCQGGGQPPPVIAIRALQTRLMVAALSCGARAGYGAFVTRFSNQLAANADALSVRYRHRGGRAAIDSLVTRLANAAAAESNTDRHGFCDRSSATLERLQRTPLGDLNRVALETWPPGVPCGAF
ncbi:hypothetical protein [Roseospira goensis]|uniref:Uncharacterized protein n=1 Tax=Roseospira goensis TaxID=391922 RepID=A0A7W6S202_9PROT|nr:hypothetical protein [Roseospira goensis]MBB4287287.1 hypothetical protein [Roseospira goensis]